MYKSASKVTVGDLPASGQGAQPDSCSLRPDKGVASGRSASAGAAPSQQQARPQDDSAWWKNWQRNEILWLNSKITELERRLWWQRVTLGSGFVLSGLGAVAMALILLQDAEPPLSASKSSFAPMPAGSISGAANSKLSAKDARRSHEAALSENAPAARQEIEKTGHQVDVVRIAEIQAEIVRAELAATQRYIRELEAAIRSAGARRELGAQ